ncbi:CotH kinase family protein [Acinetobacter pittii]|uniref:CotH kinase family protein n=1 Tax=Acinetobacter pittii TaxID=48296 RepID=UPI000837E398|nr:CotH kinase family protein [Acinetobacter pittii]MCK0915092.1 CotH kinase family protein [Acinetobacter pittii]
MAEELELVKISELPDASNVTATDLVPIVQNGITKKVTAPIVRKYVVDSLGSAATASISDFEPSGSVLEVDLKSQARADEQNKRIDRIEVAAYLLRNNKVFKAYRSKALMLADVANIPANSLVHVVNDPANNAETNDINGQYHYDGNDFLKLPDGFLDLINEKAEEALKNANLYTDSKVSAAQQIAADDASSKANAAKDTAIHTAGLDAQIKADDAKAEAVAEAAVDAKAKADNAEANAKQHTLIQKAVLLDLISQLHLALQSLNESTIFSNLASEQQYSELTGLIERDGLETKQLFSNVMLSLQLLNLAVAQSDVEKDTHQQELAKLYLSLQTLTTALCQLDLNRLNDQESFSKFHLSLKTLNVAINQIDIDKNHSKESFAKLYLAFQKVVESIAQIKTSIAASVKTALLGTDHVYTFPAPKAIAVIDIVTSKNPLPNNKEEGKFTGQVTFTIDGESVELFAQIEVQGQSSAGFPKKNWSLDLYADQGLTTSAYLKIGKIRAHDSVNFKSNFIDHLHVRQIFNLQLWQEIQNSRKGYPKQDIDNYYIGKAGKDAVPTGALAAPYMYPAVCNINGEFYGVGCIHYAKKRGNYNIAKNKPKEILIDFGGITAIDAMHPDIIEIKAPSAPTAVTLAAIERWRGFAQSSAEDMQANYASYADKQNLIDYYCFVDFICGADIVFKNLQLYTWDGKIWRIGVYDVDMTYGLDFDGKIWRFFPDYDAFQGDGFWSRIRTAFKQDIESRYAELRRSGLFSVDHVYLQMSHLLSFYPIELLNAEYSKWNPPSLSETNTTFAALLEWVKQRLVFLDAKHNYTGH